MAFEAKACPSNMVNHDPSKRASLERKNEGFLTVEGPQNSGGHQAPPSSPTRVADLSLLLQLRPQVKDSSRFLSASEYKRTCLSAPSARGTPNENRNKNEGSPFNELSTLKHKEHPCL